MTALESLNLAAPIADAYMSVEERLLVRIARQLSLNDDHQLNEVSRWQIKQLAKHGLLRQDAHKIIAAGTKGIPGDVAETVRQAIDDTLAEDGIRDLWHNEGFSESAKNAVKHYRAQAKDVYNQVNTVMKYKAESTFVRAVNSVAEKWTQEMRREQAEIADKQGVLDILNSNTAAVVSGAESRTKAVRTTIHEMAQKGIPAFVDKSGREWS
ncbi:MAG: phage minor capsid protein, partial [Oscillospiraceae bacterium]